MMSEEHLDKHYPFVAAVQSESGEWVPERTTPIGARTRHGAAIVRWSGGCPFRVGSVEGALLPCGRRVAVINTSDLGLIRRADDGRHWLPGRLKIENDEVRFEQVELFPTVTYPLTPERDLRADLANDAEFITAVQDDDFAAIANGRLCQGDLRHESGAAEPVWSSEREIARFICNVRGLGESDHRFYLGIRLDSMDAAAASRHRARFLAIAARLGWREISEEEQAERFKREVFEKLVRIVRRLLELERAEPGAPIAVKHYAEFEPGYLAYPAEMVSFDEAARIANSPQLVLARLLGLAQTGRGSERIINELLGDAVVQIVYLSRFGLKLKRWR